MGTRRRDAARSRTAILAAARELFSTGRDVPMYEIGRSAGVGQATLYRHFANRSAIAEAVVSEYVERLEQTAALHAGDERAVLVVLETGADALVEIHDLVGILREDGAKAPLLAELRGRVLAALASAAESSCGLLRDSLAADDLLLALNMVNGALVGVATADERRACAARALEIALRGLLRDPT